MNAVVRQLAGLPIALEFLTPLRLRRVQQHEARAFAQALGWYPAIGLLIGCLLLVLDKALSEFLPPAPVAALLVATLALLSGGLHLDGLADTADGMAVQGDHSRRLQVMHSGNTGPAGVMALVFVLLVQWSTLAALQDPFRSGALLLVPALARWTVVPVAMAFRPAQPDGLGQTIRPGLWPIAAPLATIIAIAASVALFGGVGLPLMLIAGVAALTIAGAAGRLLRGISGDVFGAVIEVSQAISWLAILAAQQRDWLHPTFLT
jgi:adenosylcobinamide-GDP ribazoletransferase